MRLDIVISEKYGLTRNKAQTFIKDGLVSVNGKVIMKPSLEIIESDSLELREEKQIHWVSRSAGKLDGFLENLRMKHCELRITGMTGLDVGSSTGGFTQVLLERGITHVDAVDVGTDQLHESLKQSPQVMSYEQTDIRDFQNDNPYDIIVCDASFISLIQIFPAILAHAKDDTNIILLWKPQFEVGRENLRKIGVPKDEKIIHQKQKEWEDFVRAYSCEILQKEKSTVIGETGNQEWLYFIRKKIN